MRRDDYDGVWSTMCDRTGQYRIDADVDDIAKLCEAYKLYIKEDERLKAERAAAAGKAAEVSTASRESGRPRARV